MKAELSDLLEKYNDDNLDLDEEIRLAELIADPCDKETEQFLREDFLKSMGES